MTATLHVRIPEALHASVHAAGGSRFVRNTLADAVAGRSLSPEARHAAWCDAVDLHRRALDLPATDEARDILTLAGALAKMLGPGGTPKPVEVVS